MKKIFLFGPLLLCAVWALPAFGGTTVVGNFASWDGTTAAFSFGIPYGIADDAYGQTLTVPAGYPVISSISFWVGWNFGDAVTFSGYLMAWDGTEATGPVLFQSTSASVDSSTSGIAEFDFPIPNLTLIPGNKYVFFVLASAGGGGAAAARFAVTGDSTSYAGGNFVFTDSGDFLQSEQSVAATGHGQRVWRRRLRGFFQHLADTNPNIERYAEPNQYTNADRNSHTDPNRHTDADCNFHTDAADSSYSPAVLRHLLLSFLQYQLDQTIPSD